MKAYSSKVGGILGPRFIVKSSIVFFSVLAGLLKCHNLSALGCLWYGRTFQMNGGAFQNKMHLRPIWTPLSCIPACVQGFFSYEFVPVNLTAR
jgi:hypothetical protein